MKFDILNRWSGKQQFLADIECDESVSRSVKVGFALEWAYKSDADLSGAVLSGADLSDAVLSGAVLRGAVLRGAVLRGADLSDAVLRGADLSGAVLSGAVLRGADLRDADLRDADLRDADLSGAVLRDADLSGAVLRDADLSDADLNGAYLSDAYLRDADLSGADLSGAPAIPDIHKEVYAAASAPGALDMRSWHKCGTTHCRAGWVVTLAGDAGKELERKIGTPAAAALIYLKSDPNLVRMPDFYCDNGKALADMKRLAEGE